MCRGAAASLLPWPSWPEALRKRGGAALTTSSLSLRVKVAEIEYVVAFAVIDYVMSCVFCKRCRSFIQRWYAS